MPLQLRSLVSATITWDTSKIPDLPRWNNAVPALKDSQVTANAASPIPPQATSEATKRARGRDWVFVSLATTFFFNYRHTT